MQPESVFNPGFRRSNLQRSSCQSSGWAACQETFRSIKHDLFTMKPGVSLSRTLQRDASYFTACCLVYCPHFGNSLCVRQMNSTTEKTLNLLTKSSAATITTTKCDSDTALLSPRDAVMHLKPHRAASFWADLPDVLTALLSLFSLTAGGGKRQGMTQTETILSTCCFLCGKALWVRVCCSK